MTALLTPTNMTAAEMIPDHKNPAHDPKFWCLPPVRDEPSERCRDRYPMYLVTQGKIVGVWHNWTVVKAMVSGHPSGAQRGHRTMEGCIAEWQEHCLLGVHPHPGASQRAPSPVALATASPVKAKARDSMPDLSGLSLEAKAKGHSAGSVSGMSAPVSSTSSITATTWGEVPEIARYFAMWGGRVVFTDRGEAKRAFLRAEDEGTKPRILSTVNYDEAQALAESRFKKKKMFRWFFLGPETGTVKHKTQMSQPLSHASPNNLRAPTPMASTIRPASEENLRPGMVSDSDAHPSVSSSQDADQQPPVPPVPPAHLIVTTEKTQRPRHKKGEPKARPGKRSWVYGTKLKFFERRKEEWLRASEEKTVSKFYTKIGKLYLIKYGYHVGDDQDLAEDVEDPPDSAVDEVVHEVLTAEEVSFRAEYQKTLRSRIGQWYRLEYGSLLKTDKTAFKELFTGVLDGTPPKPQRGRISHYYSRKFYETRVKDRVKQRVVSLKKRAELAGEPVPQTIDVVAKVTAEVWDEESPEFQRECELAMEREYQATVRAWEASLADSPNQTAEEMAATLENAAFYLQPFVNAISERFGIVHAGKTKGLAPVTWPKFDWIGFQEAEKSMISFASECFSDTECRARAVTTLDASSSFVAASESGITGAPRASGSGVGLEGSGAAATSSSTAAASAAVVVDAQAQAEVLAVQGQVASTTAQLGSATAQLLSWQTELSSGGAPVPNPSVLTEEMPLAAPAVAGQGGDAGAEDECGSRNDGNSNDGDDGHGDGGSDGGRGGIHDEYWRREDRADWSEELGRAHAAFERGRNWGLEWAMSAKNRPQRVGGWISRGRKWTLPPTLGAELGTRETEGLWVNEWWKWWQTLQPEERLLFDNELSRPDTANWSEMSAMYGRNGLLLVMATLCWWGEVAVGRGLGSDAQEEWLAAVRDVTWVLEAIQERGEIPRDETPGKKRKSRAASNKKGTECEEGERPTKRRREKPAETAVPRRAERLRRGASDTSAGPRTRAKSGGETGQAQRKQVKRPKPKPLYNQRKA
ncbi:hypothetical protein B0H14DRAFT_3164805 [Mycena olivaceomarginata]|nr:hypothetical protein B0H14DRAFT_3164805 [Mycena olivaceomarginata]